MNLRIVAHFDIHMWFHAVTTISAISEFIYLYLYMYVHYMFGGLEMFQGVPWVLSVGVARYKWYISGIYCQLGDYMPPTTFYGNKKQPLIIETTEIFEFFCVCFFWQNPTEHIGRTNIQPSWQACLEVEAGREWPGPFPDGIGIGVRSFCRS